MLSHPEGLAIARVRIAEEKEKRTGFLDLGRLGLTELPEELFELEYLWGLNGEAGGGMGRRAIWARCELALKRSTAPGPGERSGPAGGLERAAIAHCYTGAIWARWRA